MLQHMEWVDDCLVIEEQGHKGDQTGSKKVAKHVYANPYQPHQCPILALAVHLFSCPERSCSGKQQFFIGSDSKDRFGRILRRVVNSLSADELCQLSCASEDIGTHSLRKGSSSYALGQVNGPTPVSVYLRMGQSLGNVKDRYIHFGEGADQLCGRMITGLPFDSERFGVIPPHFPPRLASKLTIEFWDRVVSGFSKYTRGMQSAFPFMLASLIHHEQYLRNTISPNHPIFKSRVFSANPLLQELRGSTVLSIGTSPVSGLKATGIPVHLAIAKQVAGLKEAVSSLRDGITALEDKMPNVVASTVVSELRHHLAVNGGAISLQEFDSRIMNMEVRITERVCSAIRDVQLPRDNPEAVQSGDQRNWQTWSWKDGKIGHAVPRGWEFPARTNVKVLWNMWHFGDQDTGIRPYRLLSKQHDIMPQHRMRHTRVRAVMEYLENLALGAQLLPAGLTRISKLQIPMADKVFDTVFAAALSQLYSEAPNRAEDLSCGTLYNRLCQYRKNSRIK